MRGGDLYNGACDSRTSGGVFSAVFPAFLPALPSHIEFAVAGLAVLIPIQGGDALFLSDVPGQIADR